MTENTAVIETPQPPAAESTDDDTPRKSSLNIDFDSNEEQLTVFGLGDIEFGVDINHIREIVRVEDITRIPGSPDFIDGIVNLRGEVLPVLNSRSRFSMERAEYTDHSRIIVLEVKGVATGLIVDCVKEVIRADKSLMEPAPMVVKGIQSNFLEGVIKLNDGKRLILLINVMKTCMIEMSKKLEKKAASDKHAARRARKDKMIEEELIVTFIQDKEEFAFSINNVNEIIRVPDMTRVPGAPPYVKGVISLRNAVLPVVDLRLYHNMESAEYNDATRIIVVQSAALTIGLVVDKVTEVINIPKSIIESPPEILDETEKKQISGVAKFDEGKRLIMLLNADQLFHKGDMEDMDKIVKDTGGDNEYNANQEKMSGAAIDDEELLVTFRLGQEEFAVNINNVQEINRLEKVTCVPNSPDFIDGVTNLRGNVIPLISLRKRFNMELKEHDDKTRLIIVEVNKNKTALIVDAVSEVIPIYKSDIDETPRVISSNISVDFMSGIGKLDNGKRMIILLNLTNILTEKELAELTQITGQAALSTPDQPPKKTKKTVTEQVEEIISPESEEPPAVEKNAQKKKVKQVKKSPETEKKPESKAGDK